MSSPRALANQTLYLARIQLAAWRNAATEQLIPASTLAQAFAPAVRHHLLDAYGWFLLTILGVSETPAHPPRCCADLPGVAVGKSLPGEIRECQQLEQGGWVGELQAELASPSAGHAASRDNLLTPTLALPERETMNAWADALEALFDRMADSLDEY